MTFMMLKVVVEVVVITLLVDKKNGKERKRVRKTKRGEVDADAGVDNYPNNRIIDKSSSRK